jgi:Nif-specific regulatory protein
MLWKTPAEAPAPPVQEDAEPAAEDVPAAAPETASSDLAASEPAAAPEAPTGPEAVSGEMTERERLINAMERAGWVQAKAARILGLTPRQIGYALKKQAIEIKRF